MASRDLLTWPVAACLLLQSLARGGDHEPDIGNTTASNHSASLTTTRSSIWSNVTGVEVEVTRRRTVFIVGMTFLGGVSLFLLCCCVNCCMDCWRHLGLHRRTRNSGSARSTRAGAVNLAFIGDALATPSDDHPPDYFAVLAQDQSPPSSSRQRTKAHSFFKSIWSKSLPKSGEQPTDEVPPTYESVVNVK